MHSTQSSITPPHCSRAVTYLRSAPSRARRFAWSHGLSRAADGGGAVTANSCCWCGTRGGARAPSPRAGPPGRGRAARQRRRAGPQGTGARPRPPLPLPRTKWTRRVPHPVLIGHAACFRASASSRGARVLSQRPRGGRGGGAGAGQGVRPRGRDAPGTGRGTRRVQLVRGEGRGVST
jgi:hypothetical protein